MAADNKFWLVPLTITATAYVDAPPDRDAETIQCLAEDAVGMYSKTFGVMLELDNTCAGEAVESVVHEPLEDAIHDQVRADSPFPYDA